MHSTSSFLCKNIVGRGILKNLLFYEDPPILPSPPPPLFQILSNYPNLDSHCSFCCLAALAEWVIVSHLICFFYLMILWIYTYQASVS